MKDKDWKRMSGLLSKESDEIILTKPEHYRAEDPSKIKKFLGKGEIIKNPKKALKYSKKIAKGEDLILITGSIYFIGEILDSF